MASSGSELGSALKPTVAYTKYKVLYPLSCKVLGVAPWSPGPRFLLTCCSAIPSVRFLHWGPWWWLQPRSHYSQQDGRRWEEKSKTPSLRVRHRDIVPPIDQNLVTGSYLLQGSMGEVVLTPRSHVPTNWTQEFWEIRKECVWGASSGPAVVQPLGHLSSLI